MGNNGATSKQIKRLSVCFFMLFVMIVAVTYVTSRAETTPDISSLDPSYYQPYNQRFFAKQGGGYLMTSTDNAYMSMVTLLDAAGNLDDSLGSSTVRVSFPYIEAAVCGDNLYLVGTNPDNSKDLQICRFSTKDGRRIYNQIIDVSYDLSRGFHADESGNLTLVTVSYGSELTETSPFWIYAFRADANGANCVGVPVPAEESSAPPSSTVSSATASSSDSGDSSLESSAASSASSAEPNDPQPVNPSAEPYVFAGPVTVESLQLQLDSDGRGAAVRVIAPNGSQVISGMVGTGCEIEVLRNGQVESCVTAVIPGDLIGTGDVTEQDYRFLYEHIIHQQELNGIFFQAADLNHDGKLDTRDMLKIKSMMN